jgi:hypothetical protein
MSNFAKAARLVLAVTMPGLAMAQSPQAKPSPLVRSAASNPSGAALSPAPDAQPAAVPSAQRFVTSENFYRPKPQPASSAPAAAQPLAQRPAATNSNAALAPRPGFPQAIQPAVVVASPVIAKPETALAQPAVASGSPTVAGHEASVAVDYSSGQLTVVSDKASLNSVLKLIGAKTGAVVDLAPELQNEQVVARLGPGSVREVLTGLLDSPRIDYIVFGTGDEPGSLHRIVVRTRHSFGQIAMSANQPRQPVQAGHEDENGRVLTNGAAPADGQLTQEQLMENWRKIREEKLQAEIKQQAEDRENEKNQPPEPPMPQDTPPPDNPPQR